MISFIVLYFTSLTVLGAPENFNSFVFFFLSFFYFLLLFYDTELGVMQGGRSVTLNQYTNEARKQAGLEIRASLAKWHVEELHEYPSVLQGFCTDNFPEWAVRTAASSQVTVPTSP